MKQKDDQLSILFPLFAIGTLIILSICVFASYQNTSRMQPTVIIPGGTTYIGK